MTKAGDKLIKAVKEAVHRAVNAVVNEGARVENFRKQSKTKAAFGAVAK